MSLNRAILIGRVGGNPQIRTVGDQKVASFSLATSEKYKGKDGNLVESTEWHNISIWGKLAEVVEKYVTSGSQLYVEGKIKTEKYTDKEGAEKFITRILGSTLQMLGGKSENQSQPQEEPKRFDPRAVKTTPIVDDLPPDDDGLPF
ncbi:MAG: single-stranded DNA-binding protein [Bacteroidales bacterium]|nr:single-stranded DNA-binding protein [Bacteroidales bacterium]